MKRDKKRILGRILARELTLEELGVIPAGATIIVASPNPQSDAVSAIDADGDDSGPPVSTLVATLPDYHEDR